MKHFLLFILVTIFILFITYNAHLRYSYIDKYMYVYKFKDNYTITMVDRHGAFYQYKVDSTQYEYFRKHRKGMFLMRVWDYGKIKYLKQENE